MRILGGVEPICRAGIPGVMRNVGPFISRPAYPDTRAAAGRLPVTQGGQAGRWFSTKGQGGADFSVRGVMAALMGRPQPSSAGELGYVGRMLAEPTTRNHVLNFKPDATPDVVRKLAPLVAYTVRGDLVKNLNIQLRFGGLTDQNEQWCRDIDLALGLLPLHGARTTYRKIMYDANPEDFAVGSIYVDKGLMSTSKSPGDDDQLLDARNLLLCVTGDPNGRGRDISRLSGFTKEEEVLFPSASRFIVTDFLDHGNDKYTVYVQEVSR